MNAPYYGPQPVRTNARDLVLISVAGQIAPPIERGTPWRTGYDGKSRSLPGSGGIVLNQRIGDPCVGLAGDHVEPAVSIRSEQSSIVGGRTGPNQALQTYACVGNEAIVTSGRASGARGVVTGKHGGVDTVLIDFPVAAMRRMAIGDRIQVWAHGLGLRLTNFPDVAIWNCSPKLLDGWQLQESDGQILARVSHLIPARLMGSGLGKNNVLRGDYDIQMSDPVMVRKHHLGTLRFGDLVAITGADNRFGRSRLEGFISIGVVVHSDSMVAGHGPGVVSLLSAPAARFRLEVTSDANIANTLGVRSAQAPRATYPLPTRERRERLAAIGRYRLDA